jgi:hypothetical protein
MTHPFDLLEPHEQGLKEQTKWEIVCGRRTHLFEVLRAKHGAALSYTPKPRAAETTMLVTVWKEGHKPLELEDPRQGFPSALLVAQLLLILG